MSTERKVSVFYRKKVFGKSGFNARKTNNLLISYLLLLICLKVNKRYDPKNLSLQPIPLSQREVVPQTACNVSHWPCILSEVSIFYIEIKFSTIMKIPLLEWHRTSPALCTNSYCGKQEVC